jgi:hypothetical protein
VRDVEDLGGRERAKRGGTEAHRPGRVRDHDSAVGGNGGRGDPLPGGAGNEVAVGWRRRSGCGGGLMAVLSISTPVALSRRAFERE